MDGAGSAAPAAALLITMDRNALKRWMSRPMAAPPPKRIHIAPDAHRSGNIEDRRGQRVMTPEEQERFQSDYERPDRYAQWLNDEYAAAQGAQIADPDDRAWREAILRQQRRLDRGPAQPPAWAPMSSSGNALRRPR